MNLTRIEAGLSATVAVATFVLAAACFIPTVHAAETVATTSFQTAIATSALEERLEQFAAVLPGVAVAAGRDQQSNAGKIIRSVDVRGKRVLAE